jgi:hypothetical protein
MRQAAGHKEIKTTDLFQHSDDIMKCYQMKSCQDGVWKLSLGEDPSPKGNRGRTQRFVSAVWEMFVYWGTNTVGSCG